MRRDFQTKVLQEAHLGENRGPKLLAGRVFVQILNRSRSGLRSLDCRHFINHFSSQKGFRNLVKCEEARAIPIPSISFVYFSKALSLLWTLLVRLLTFHGHC
jgi:hypothetical protein